jgi:hypothetical protein
VEIWLGNAFAIDSTPGAGAVWPGIAEARRQIGLAEKKPFR